MQLPDMLLPGQPAPLGSQARDGGVHFAVWSEHAQAIELCLFDAAGRLELKRWPLHGPQRGVFHGFLPGAGVGSVYGFRAHGPYEPARGHRFNPHKLLLDPYAREIVGRFEWRHEHHGYRIGHADGPRSFDERDNGRDALKARVSGVPWPADRPEAPRLDRADVVLYEVHVKGFSQRHPGIPPALRGRYAGLAHAAAIEHFRALGVTTLSLLPVQYHLDEPALAAAGRSNHWGYNTLGFFAPDPRFAQQPDDPAAVNAEFRRMVDGLHAAGLQVVLDVVYNHTPEGNEWGPTLSFRGLDNASWYRLDPADASRCENFSGCGNTVNIEHPRVAQFVIDSLRHWVQQMGVDGFRFDLAPVLGRTRAGFDPEAPLFRLLRADPVLSQVLLIAEPWDAGPQGYQLGRFPGPFMEWNDRFRDAVRGYWLGARVGRGEFARRFAGSSDLFQAGGRGPHASVNFITAHDGFTLNDVVSYSRKHNQANGEDNRDGRDDELCASFGIEGPAADPAVCDARQRVRRAMLATLLLAQGTPMLLAGDEIGHTQQGNNNAYCQDNELSWLGWPEADTRLSRFVGELLALRRAQPLLRHARWFETEPRTGEPGLAWRAPHGAPMQPADWQEQAPAAFACEFLPPAGQRRPRLLVLFNPLPAVQPFTLPSGRWQLALDSSATLACGEAAGDALHAPPRALLVLRESLSPA
ncbi:MAG: glycogen debranching protein GlgX [Pseudomonadota bacterium]